MNADLSMLTDVGAAFALLWHGLGVSLLTMLSSWWGATVIITVAVVAAATWASPLGDDESGPLLTERDRQVSHRVGHKV